MIEHNGSGDIDLANRADEQNWVEMELQEWVVQPNSTTYTIKRTALVERRPPQAEGP